MGNQTSVPADGRRYATNHEPLKNSISQNENPYSSPAYEGETGQPAAQTKEHRGPLLCFAFSMLSGALIGFPLIIPRSLAVKDDPNPVGYLLILLSFPAGGLTYRIRSRRWPIDPSVRSRQIRGCVATLAIPAIAVLLTGARGQGLTMSVFGGIISLVFMAGILVSGRRRSRKRA